MSKQEKVITETRNWASDAQNISVYLEATTV